MDGWLVMTIRGAIHALVRTVRFAIGVGERLANARSAGSATKAHSRIAAAKGGVPAVALAMSGASSAPMESSTPPVRTEPASQCAPDGMNGAPNAFKHESSGLTRAENALPINSEADDLEWAGSIAHAAVSSLHLGRVLSMVRAGWLVPCEAHAGNVTKALDAIEAFQDRTSCAIAPTLESMTDEECADFFESFGSNLPPEFSDLDGAP